MTLRPAAAIVPLTQAMWLEGAAIFEAGIAYGHATFEVEAPTWERFEATRLPDHRLAALDADGGLLGWATVAAVSGREVYRGVVENALYVAPSARGRGIGRLLLDALVASTEAAGIWTIQATIFPENEVSLAVHERAGFRVVGVRERLGLMQAGPRAGEWRDVLQLERRSAVAGI